MSREDPVLEMTAQELMKDRGLENHIITISNNAKVGQVILPNTSSISNSS